MSTDTWEEWAIDSIVDFSMQHVGEKHIASYTFKGVKYWTGIHDNSEDVVKEACEAIKAKGIKL